MFEEKSDRKKCFLDHANGCYLLGPTGPTGPAGPASIQIGGASAVSFDEGASVANIGTEENVILEFQIPMGPTGATGSTGPTGEMGPTGEAGPQGEIGPIGLPGEIGPMGPTGETGPTGPTGEMGPPGVPGIAGKHGATGPQGPTGPTGEIGPTGPQGATGVPGEMGLPGEMGPTGPTGPSGTSVTILGSYDSYSDLTREHPTGSIGDSYLVGDDLYVWSNENQTWNNVGMIRGPQGLPGTPGLDGETGPTGPTGPIGPTGLRGATGPTGMAGPEEIATGYFVTYNSGFPEGGFAVHPNERIPISVEAMDNTSLFTLENNTIRCGKEGVYRIDFIVSAEALDSPTFLKNLDFVSIGFRKVGEQTVYAGGSVWDYFSPAITINGQGMFIVGSPDDTFELVCFSKKTIYLESPKLEDTLSQSYFVNPVVSILIQYLG